MMRSLYSGVSGLKNHQTRMDVVGNNISNVNTTGFKSSRVTFSDTLSQTLSGASAPTDNTGGTNPKQIGLGSSVSSIDTLFTDGSVQNTGKNTDLCLSGNGLFVVKNGSETFYTRNGAFEFDAAGNYVMPGSGLFVQGWTAKNPDGTINTAGTPENITIPTGKSMAATATTSIVYDKNLNASTEGYKIANILATYDDGTSKTLSNYPSGVVSITSDQGKTLDLDESAFGKFTTGDALANKYLYSTTINSVEAHGNLGISLGAGDKINKITMANDDPVTMSNVANGTYAVGDKMTISGTIDTKGVTASGTNKGETVLTVTLQQPQGLQGNKVKIYVPNPQNFTYKDNDNVSFDLPITSLTPGVGDKINTPEGSVTLEAQDLNHTTIPITTAAQKFDYYGRADGSDGTIISISREEKKASSIVITTAEGKQLTGLVDGEYKKDDIFYPSMTTLTTIYDSLGGEHSLPILLTKKANNTWALSLGNGGDSTVITDSVGNKMNVSLKSTDLVFDDLGSYISGDGTLNIHYDYGGTVTGADGSIINPPSDQTVNINLAAITQYSGSSTVNGQNNGNSAGTLKSVSIDSSGVITGTYTNGLKQAEGQVAIAQFNNAAGLTKSGSSLYSESNNSGTANIKSASALGVTITPSALEMSNVDMASELTDMIVTQRGYQSNSKIITVSDELLETLINMKR